MNIEHLSDDTQITMTVGELRGLIEEVESSARLEELNYVRGFIPGSESVKARVVKLQKGHCCESQRVVRILGNEKRYKMTLLQEKPEKQYIVRRA